MANMTIENIGGFMRSGNLETVIDRGHSIENPISPATENAAAEGSKNPTAFADMLSKALDETNEIQLQADRAAKELIAGRNKNIHETMLLLEKADMSFKLMTQVRNKIIDAYREILRMQV